MHARLRVNSVGVLSMSLHMKKKRIHVRPMRRSTYKTPSISPSVSEQPNSAQSISTGSPEKEKPGMINGGGGDNWPN